MEFGSFLFHPFLPVWISLHEFMFVHDAFPPLVLMVQGWDLSIQSRYVCDLKRSRCFRWCGELRVSLQLRLGPQPQLLHTCNDSKCYASVRKTGTASSFSSQGSQAETENPFLVCTQGFDASDHPSTLACYCVLWPQDPSVKRARFTGGSARSAKVEIDSKRPLQKGVC